MHGGRLFATDLNQATHAHNGQNNSPRIVTVDPDTGKVMRFITGLPTGDHPTEQLAFKDNFIYWSQGSTTNSGVVGRDNGGGANQPETPKPPPSHPIWSASAASDCSECFDSLYQTRGTLNEQDQPSVKSAGITDARSSCPMSTNRAIFAAEQPSRWRGPDRRRLDNEPY